VEGNDRGLSYVLSSHLPLRTSHAPLRKSVLRYSNLGPWWSWVVSSTTGTHWTRGWVGRTAGKVTAVPVPAVKSDIPYTTIPDNLSSVAHLQHITRQDNSAALCLTLVRKTSYPDAHAGGAGVVLWNGPLPLPTAISAQNTVRMPRPARYKHSALDSVESTNRKKDFRNVHGL
jgi:hypothetical protein